MSPRNRPGPAAAAPLLSVILALSLILLLLAGSAHAQELQDAGSKNIFIQFYQDHISGADGGRCPMHPSCSAYAARAIEKHGPVLGWIMACDRLVRCGRDEVRVSPAMVIKGQPYVFDPVRANDFWWFNRPTTPLSDNETLP